MEAEKKVSKEQAEAALIAERTERENACLAEVNAALEKHRCELRFVQTHVNGQFFNGIHQVVARN